MAISRESILQNGTLIRKETDNFEYDHVFITGCFRIFYSLSGPTSPRNVQDSNHDNIPDYIENIAFRFETARILLTDSFGLKDPLAGGTFLENGTKFIDIYLQEIPREHGIASDRIYDLHVEILEGSTFQGKSLRIKIHRNLIARTGTPLHEFFHLCQYSYSMFNNMWFMEGLARWSQSIITEGTGKEEKLPETVDEVVTLLKKYHDAEFFWNRLTALCDPVGTFQLPEVLKNNEDIANNRRPGAKLIKKILENTTEQFKRLLVEQESRQLDKNDYWSEIEKKSPNNNKYILQAVIDAINTTCTAQDQEIRKFVKASMEVISGSTSLYRTDSIQSFMATLRKCDPELCIESDAEYCYSDHFDPHTRTLTVPRLDCSSLTDEDFESFYVLEHVNGDLVIRDNPDVTTLEGLRNLETVNGRLELVNSGVSELSGLTRLRLVKWMNIEQMAELQSISGFTSLSLVRNALRIVSNPKMQSITGFTSLEGSRTGLIIQDNSILERITGFMPLSRIDYGPFVLKDNPVLETVHGLTGLTFVRDTLSISNCPELSDFSFLLFLEHAGNIEVNNTKLSDGSPFRTLFKKNPHFKGSIKFTQNRGLTDLSFMRGLRTVDSSLYLHQNSLVNVDGLGQLRRVGASFNLSANKLSDISQLSNLEEIEGILGLSYNRLSSLHGLENLRHIRSKNWGKDLMSIKFNDNRHPDGSISLEDIGALSNVYEVTNRLVVYTDSEGGHRYSVKPGSDSTFYRRNANFEVYGRTSATVLPLSHICEVGFDAREKFVFPAMSEKWQRTFANYEWMDPHFFPFRDVDKVVLYCLENDISIVVGIELSSQRFLSRHGRELRSHGLRLIDNELQTLNDCENKHDFRLFMEKHGFGGYIPIYYDSLESIQYPCIVKPFYGSFGSGQRIVHSEQELGNVGEKEVVCEYITGHVEYVTHFFYMDRNVYRDVTYKKTYHKPFFILGREDKSNLVYERVSTPCLDLLVEILDRMQFKGICCFNYKPVRNEPKIFEINARIGFTLAAHPYDFKELFDLYVLHTS